MRGTVHIRAQLLLLAGGVVLLFSTSCITTSNLAGVSASSIKAVNRIADEDVQKVASPSDESHPSPTETIVGAPAQEKVAQIDPVAQKRQFEPKPAVSLTSVPRTSVGKRPTNQIMMVRTTAYSHLQADSLPYGRLSAAGNTLQYGSEVRSAAADWSKYPLGTRFVIEGLPYQYVVDDYGSALVGTETIDIYRPSLRGIGEWGVRNVPIRVLEWGSFQESAKILDERKHVKHAGHVRKMLSDIERQGLAGYKKSGGSA
jgi:3D (Asp-Asp-Asp) domain-containing protein|tara:strand:+ start:651 stop:1424 length:774 start_codon:yes stop_codon:yes gene_type:complete